MFFSLIVYGLPFLLAPIFLIALIAVINERRVSKKSTYYRVREAARKGMRRWSLVGVLCLVGIGIALTARTEFERPSFKNLFTHSEPTAGSALSSPVPTASLNPTLTPKSPYDAPPTITPTQPTPTLSPTPPVATLPSAVTPPPDALLTITAIASGITANLGPLDAGNAFPAGVTRLYFFYAYENMVNGMSWSRVLVFNDEIVRNETEAWLDGEEGTMYYWFSEPAGWPAGDYEIRFYAGDAVLASVFFIIGD